MAIDINNSPYVHTPLLKIIFESSLLATNYTDLPEIW